MSGPAGKSHLQLFVLAPSALVTWRLLSGNNREIGRAVDGFEDAESTRLAIKQAQAQLDELVTKVRRVASNHWGWELLTAHGPLVRSSHRFDRLIRCEQGAAQFRLQFAEAPVGAVVMVSGARCSRAPVHP